MGAYSLIVVINLLNRFKMSQQFVTILMPNGHREKVKVTPGTIIQPLFADLLKKHGFKAADFSLKSSTGKPVDVSVPFRLTGIANRATLESCQKNKSDTSSASASSSIVQVAVQMPDGLREVVKIEDDCPLWDIIEHLIDKMPHLLDDDDVEPCLSFMSHTFRGPEVLLEKTLRECGLSGGALLRLSFIHRLPVDSNSGLWEGDLDFGSIAQDSFLLLDAKETKSMATKASLETVVENKAVDTTTSTKSTTDSGIADNEALRESKNSTCDQLNTVSEQQPQSKVEQNFSREQTFVSSSRGIGLPKEVQPFSWIPSDALNKQIEPINSTFGNNNANTDVQRNRFANFKFPEKSSNDTAMEVDNTKNDENKDAENKLSADREIKVFSSDDFSTNIEELPDSFFDITVEDLKIMQKLREKELKSLSDQPLMTEEGKKRKTISKLSSNFTILRFVVPDRVIVQAKFALQETSRAIHSYVESLLLQEIIDNSNIKFYLFTTPPKNIIKNDTKTLLELNLYPGVNVHVSFGENNNFESYLKPEFAEQRQTPEVLSKSESSKSVVDSTDSTSSAEATTSINAAKESSENPTKVAKKGPKDAPKWFTAGLKK